jgi:hypothetical protein
MRKKYQLYPVCSSVESTLQLDIKYKSSEGRGSNILRWLAAVEQFDSLFVFTLHSIIVKVMTLTFSWDTMQRFLVVLGEGSLYYEYVDSWPSRKVYISYQTTWRYFSEDRNLHSRRNFLRLLLQDFLLTFETARFSLFNTTFWPHRIFMFCMSLRTRNHYFFTMTEMLIVYCAVWTGHLNITLFSFGLAVAQVSINS